LWVVSCVLSKKFLPWKSDTKTGMTYDDDKWVRLFWKVGNLLSPPGPVHLECVKGENFFPSTPQPRNFFPLERWTGPAGGPGITTKMIESSCATRNFYTNNLHTNTISSWNNLPTTHNIHYSAISHFNYLSSNRQAKYYKTLNSRFLNSCERYSAVNLSMQY